MGNRTFTVEGTGRSTGPASAVWKALVEYTASTRATALAPRQSLSALYRNAGVRDDHSRRGYLRASLYAVFPRYRLCLSPGASGALGKHIEIHLLFTNPAVIDWGDIKDPRLSGETADPSASTQFLKIAELPLFRDSENAGQLFNSDGEQDVGNPLLASWGVWQARLHLSPF